MRGRNKSDTRGKKEETGRKKRLGEQGGNRRKIEGKDKKRKEKREREWDMKIGRKDGEKRK